jgi:RIP metalloprotease RseP
MQVMPDGRKELWEESPKLYWFDEDYVSTNTTLGPGKWYHSEGPYSEARRRYECVFFYINDVYREEMVFEIEYEMTNAALKYNDCSELYLTFYSEEIFVPTTTPKAVITASFSYLWKITRIMVYGLWQLVTGKIPASEMHGILAITKIGGDIIEQNGLLGGLLLTAMISVNLAIINLLPIPALDGGHLFMLFIEKLLGRKLNEEKVEKISNACFFALLILMVLIIFNDVFALITKKF